MQALQGSRHCNVSVPCQWAPAHAFPPPHAVCTCVHLYRLRSSAWSGSGSSRQHLHPWTQSCRWAGFHVLRRPGMMRLLACLHHLHLQRQACRHPCFPPQCPPPPLPLLHPSSHAPSSCQAECSALRAMINCNVCHQRQKDTIITKCWHMFCQQCIRTNLGEFGQEVMAAPTKAECA